MKKIIILDFDNTKFDTRAAHANYVNHTYGINSESSEYVNNASITNIIKNRNPGIKATNEEIMAHLGEHFHTSISWHEDVTPVDIDTVEVIRELAKKYTLITATARQNMGEEVVRFLIDKYIKGCVSDLHFCNIRYGYGKYTVVSKRIFASSLLHNNEVVAFIDDSTKEINRMQDLIPSYLFDPEGLHDNLLSIQNRVRDWKKIGELFL